jgi:hypothetical protein
MKILKPWQITLDLATTVCHGLFNRALLRYQNHYHHHHHHCYYYYCTTTTVLLLLLLLPPPLLLLLLLYHHRCYYYYYCITTTAITTTTSTNTTDITNTNYYCYCPLRGPHLWLREVAIPRYLSYPVPGGITGLPGPRVIYILGTSPPGWV